MSKHNRQFRLDLLSQIPIELIEKAAADRYKLLSRLRPASAKRPIFSRRMLTSAIAALLLLTFGTVLIWFLSSGAGVVPVTKQVPVYEGMTVSTSLPSFDSLESSEEVVAVELLAANSSAQSESQLLEKLYEQQNLFDIPESQSMYSAHPHQDVYITVHLSNPDNFEILSFTLNGVKYSSYMFETGSDMENLILKCNVGNAEGIIEYSIDAVKYVDGESIKDVRMEGDRTVKVAIYTEEQPTATISNVFSSFESVTFTATAMDSFGLLELYGGKFYAVLYDGKEIVYQQELSGGTPKQITWGGLSKNTQFQCAVIGIYDALDGTGVAIHILANTHFSTTDIFTLSEMKIDHHSASFVHLWDQSYQGERVLQSLTLYDANEVVRQLATDATQITDLLAGHTYRLVAVYVNEGTKVAVTQEFTTKAYAKPRISFYCFEYYPDRVEFDVTVLDLDRVGELTQIVLLDENGDVIRTGAPNVRSFGELECPKTYTVQAVYSYDLQDGKGTRILKTNYQIVTQSKGLAVRSDGVVTGMGSCTDRELYINMPVEAGAFNKSIITKVVFGSNATYIGGAAFESCPYLEEVILAEGIKTIYMHAFKSSSLKYPLYIPASISTIEAGAIQTDATVPIYCAIAEQPVGWHKSWTSAVEAVIWNVSHTTEDEQGLKYAVLNNGELVILSFDNSTDTVILPEGVVEIRSYAFRETRIKEIVFPSTVRSVGAQAFAYCKKLKTVVLNEGLTSMANYAFAYNRALEEIVIPSTIQTMGMNIFLDCWALKKVTLPEGLTAIPYQFLAGCSSLTTVNIPSTVTRIEDGAFNGCEQLSAIVFPEGLQFIGQEMFVCCYQLRYFVLSESVKEIKFLAFDGNAGDPTKIFLKADRIPSGFDINWRNYDYTVVYFGFKEWYTDENGVLYACLKDGTKIAVE